MLCLRFAMFELIYILSKLSCNKVSSCRVWYKLYLSYVMAKSSYTVPEFSVWDVQYYALSEIGYTKSKLCYFWVKLY